MTEILYKEFGIKMIIRKTKLYGPYTKGIKMFKPFVAKNEIWINLADGLHKVCEIDFYNNKNELIERSLVQMDTNIRIGGIIINNLNNILLLNRLTDKEYYCFPGGHMREKETKKQCLIREMKEETNIDISKYNYNLIYEMYKDGFGPEYFYIIDLKDDPIIYQDEDASDKTSKLELKKIEDLKNINNLYPEEIIKIIQQIYETKSE